jgi:hypothetical protein
MFAILKANLLATALGILAAVFIVITLVLTVQLHGFLWIDGANDKLEDCARDRAELRALSQKKDEQAERTGNNIEQSEKQQQISDKIAREIEEAPVAPNCETPPEIMGADL